MVLVASLEAWECNLSSCFRSLLHAVYRTRHTSICMIRRPSEAITDHRTRDSGAATCELVLFHLSSVLMSRKLENKSLRLWSLEQKNWWLRFWLEKSWCRRVLEFQDGCTRTHLVQKHSLVLQSLVPFSMSSQIGPQLLVGWDLKVKKKKVVFLKTAGSETVCR